MIAIIAATSLLDDHRELEPPDPIPNSDVKRFLADGSVGLPHVRVGHRQAFKLNASISNGRGVLLCGFELSHGQARSLYVGVHEVPPCT